MNEIMKKIIFISLLAALMAVAACAKDPELKIEYSQLPEQAQQFLEKNFPGVQTKKTTQKYDDGIAEYKVYLKNGAVVEFDMIGGWNEIMLKKGDMPRSVLPAVILETLDSRFGDKRIVKLDNDGYKYEIKFSDKSEVEITANGVITDYDHD